MRGKAAQCILAALIMIGAAKMLWRFRGPGGPDDSTRTAPMSAWQVPAAPPSDASAPAWGSEPIPIPAWAGGDTALAFGDKCQWLAVKTAKPEAVARLLKLRHCKQSSWKDGLDAAFDAGEQVFVTPPIDGWVLAVDPHFVVFPDMFDKPEIAAGWSKVLRAPVRVFISDRRSGTYGFIKADDGRVTRFYMNVEDKVMANVGPETPDEKELRPQVRAHPSGQLAETGDLLLLLAARWSLDPNTLDRRHDLPAFGLLGEAPPL